MLTLRRVRTPALLLAGLLTLLSAGICIADDEVPRVRVAVYDHTNGTEWEGRLIGRRGGDAVHAALAATGHWELVDRGRVIRMCESEGLQPPYGVGYLQMLGERMSAALSVTGLVRTLEVNARRGVAQVTLQADVVENIGGQTIASARGVSAVRRAEGEIVPMEVIVDRALNEAAAEIARSLTNLPAVNAPVVSVLPDGRLVIDGPDDEPLHKGDVLLIYRDGRMPVGAARVERVSLTVIHAEPLAGADFMTNDRAVLVAR